MVGLKVKDVNKDILTIFILCYEYNLNFTQVIKLYSISKKYFWTFLDIMSNVTKIGNRKALNIRKSVDKILNIIKNNANLLLSPLEDSLLEAFSFYIEDSFTDGETCLDLKQLKIFPAIKGFGENDKPISSSYEDIDKNIDRIKYIKIVDTIYYKTSKMLFYIEKYSGSVNISDIENMTTIELLHLIRDSREKYEQFLKEHEVVNAK